MPEPEDKPFAIPRPLVWGAWRRTVGRVTSRASAMLTFSLQTHQACGPGS
jgi:hypothetical protein